MKEDKFMKRLKELTKPDKTEYTCEICFKKVIGYKGVTKHSQKFHHYKFKDKDNKDMRLLVV